VYELVGEYGLTPHIRSRGEEKQELARETGFRARRWVVERTHSWLNRFRGLLIRWSKKPENHRACCNSHAASSPGASPSRRTYRDRL
jgi:putative transposase